MFAFAFSSHMYSSWGGMYIRRLQYFRTFWPPLLPPSSAFHATYQYCSSAKLANFRTPPSPLNADVLCTSPHTQQWCVPVWSSCAPARARGSCYLWAVRNKPAIYIQPTDNNTEVTIAIIIGRENEASRQTTRSPNNAKKVKAPFFDWGREGHE